jgi:hypothetical protein
MPRKQSLHRWFAASGDLELSQSALDSLGLKPGMIKPL